MFADSGEVDVAATDLALLNHGVALPRVTPDEAATPSETSDSDLHDDVMHLLGADGQKLWTKAEAEQVKENYAARLKQLEYDREMGLVVTIDDVVVAVASEYAVVRNRLLGLGSKVAPEIAAMGSAEEIKALIDEEVIEALNQLTVDVDGERDFDKLRGSIQARFGTTADEATPRA